MAYKCRDIFLFQWYQLFVVFFYIIIIYWLYFHIRIKPLPTDIKVLALGLANALFFPLDFTINKYYFGSIFIAK